MDQDGTAEVAIVVKVDHIQISGIVANRGNCRIYNAVAIQGANALTTFPFNLNFGETLTVDMLCNPIELQVQTSHGTIPITWKQ